MSAEQEAQQAQTIAHIRKNQNTGNDLCREDDFIAALLKIVDSQAQKIASLEYDLSDHKDMLKGVVGLHKDACEKIAEHAKEIERLKDCMFQHMDSDTYNHCQEYLEKMRGKNENKTANEIDDV